MDISSKTWGSINYNIYVGNTSRIMSNPAQYIIFYTFIYLNQERGYIKKNGGRIVRVSVELFGTTTLHKQTNSCQHPAHPSHILTSSHSPL